MRHLPVLRLLVLLGLTAGVWARGATPDARLAGYWVSPPEAASPVAYTFSIFGKWAIVSPHVTGTTESKARYTAESTGNSGTLTLDEPADKAGDAVRIIHYELQGGELTLELTGPAQSARFRLVKGVPPSQPRVEMVDLAKSKPAPVKPAPPVAPVKKNMELTGSWATEPGAEKQLILFIARGRTTDLMLNQNWTKGSDTPVAVSRTGYMVTFANNRGQMTLAHAAPEGSQIPAVLNFAFEGEALVITVGDGNFAGQYRLLRKDK